MRNKWISKEYFREKQGKPKPCSVASDDNMIDKVNLVESMQLQVNNQ